MEFCDGGDLRNLIDHHLWREYIFISHHRPKQQGFPANHCSR
jgi:hypothetical protein